MALRPVVLVTPSLAAAVLWPRRLASTGKAVAGLFTFKPLDLARAIAEPLLLGRGLQPWDHGLAAHLVATLIAEHGGSAIDPELPRDVVARTLARTFVALRAAGVAPERLFALAGAARTTEDRSRLALVHDLFTRYDARMEERYLDAARLFRAAAAEVERTDWLRATEVLATDDFATDAVERDFLAALARAVPVRIVAREVPEALATGSLRDWARQHAIAPAALDQTVLAPLAVPEVPAGLERLRRRLFEPPAGDAVRDGSVELLTAASEAAEVKTVARRLLREAGAGVAFEDMGVVLPRPDLYAPLFADLFRRIGIPFRLHPSLPLLVGRSARSLLLLLRSRELRRFEVMEFLTFAPIPLAAMLGRDDAPPVASWDQLSRDAGIVSGLERWRVGLSTHAELERRAARGDADERRRDRRLERAREADALLAIVERLARTHARLESDATWPEWSRRLNEALDEWIVAADEERARVAEVVADLAALGSLGRTASPDDVAAALQARFEWERVPLEPVATGAVHVGAMDAIAGIPFRVVAIPGLVEGGYPGVLRPDPFLLDAERAALETSTRPASSERPLPKRHRQLSLFDLPFFDAPGAAVGALPLLLTTQHRLLEARRDFHRALSQATQKLFVSYPRGDPRSGRERMPSLFFVAVASALQGHSVGVVELAGLVREDGLDSLSVDFALDAGERDRIRARADDPEVELTLAAGSSFFKRSRLASKARWSKDLTAYDGLIAFPPQDVAAARTAAAVRAKLDPVTAARPTSASRLGTFSLCGFRYLLEHVLRLEPALEPEERRRLEPLEKGDAFHRVAEHFLRELREAGELPVKDSPELRSRLLARAEAALETIVKGSPPRFVALWEREKTRFRESVLKWLEREARAAGHTTPAHFEVSFGDTPEPAPGEPHLKEPLAIDLGDGRTLRVSGKIDRIDATLDGLVLRDYKTGKAPRDDGGVFRGGRQLQIPFYILAASRLFPDRPVREAFLDYVDGGRQVAIDPAAAHGETFRDLLRRLVDAIAEGVFLQEPSACDFCDYTPVCGPKPLIAIRRRYKVNDSRVRRVLQLRDIG